MKSHARSSRWQGWVMLILGLWLFSSPAWLPGFASKASAAAENAYLIGLILIGLGWSSVVRAQEIEEWVEMALDLPPHGRPPAGEPQLIVSRAPRIRP